MDTALASVVTAACTLGGISVTAALGYSTLRRRFSGDIRTVEAKALWKDNAALRETVMAQNVRLDERVQELELTVTDLRKKLEAVQRERDELAHRITVLEAEGQHKDGEIKRLKDARGLLETRVAELEEELRQRMEVARVSTERTSKLAHDTEGRSSPLSNPNVG